MKINILKTKIIKNHKLLTKNNVFGQHTTILFTDSKNNQKYSKWHREIYNIFEAKNLGLFEVHNLFSIKNILLKLNLLKLCTKGR